MTQLIHRLRHAVSSLGNAGAVANALGELARATADRAAVEQLALRMAVATEPTRAPAAA